MTAERQIDGQSELLITREEAAVLLRCSVSKLAKGWGPKPHPEYKRPRMYLRDDVMAWLRRHQQTPENPDQCFTPEATSGGASSSTEAVPTASRQTSASRVQALARRRAKRKASSRRGSSSKRVLVVVPPPRE